MGDGSGSRRGHCTSLLEGSNRKDSLRECLIELNLEFDISFPYYSASIYLSIQVCTYFQYDSIEFMRLDELKEPRVKSMDGEEGYEW